jgi:hypothetical protein
MTDQVQQNAPQQDPAAQSTDLTINDLNALKVIIDIASSRGAFKPNEMVAVGQTYTKLETFLNAVAKQPAQSAQSTQPVSDQDAAAAAATLGV